MLDSNLVAQGNTGLSRFNPTSSGKPMAVNTGILDMNSNSLTPVLGSGTGITNTNKSSADTSGQQNDMSQTNKYLSALNTYGDMRKIQGEMDGIQQPQQSALPNFNADQAKAFFSALGGMFGGGAGQQPGHAGLNQLFGGMSQQPQAPQMVAGDNSRFANDPFKVDANALR